MVVNWSLTTAVAMIGCAVFASDRPQAALEFMYVYNLCEASVQRDECPVVYRYKLEVVSRHKVRLRVKVFTPAIAQVKASSTDHSPEFVARDNP